MDIVCRQTIFRMGIGFLVGGRFSTHLEEAILLYVGQLSIICHGGTGPRIISGPRDGKTILAAASPSRLLRRPLAAVSAASESTPLGNHPPKNNPFSETLGVLAGRSARNARSMRTGRKRARTNDSERNTILCLTNLLSNNASHFFSFTRAKFASQYLCKEEDVGEYLSGHFGLSRRSFLKKLGKRISGSKHDIPMIRPSVNCLGRANCLLESSN